MIRAFQIACLALSGCWITAASAADVPSVASSHPTIPAAVPAVPPQAIGVPHYTAALLGGLDKTSARVTQFAAPLGQSVHFGTLIIKVTDCRKHPPELDPESAAFVEIGELYPGQATPRQLFSGWMFASSPALSALEHPVYDVWVLDCTMSNGSSGKSG